MDVKQCTKCHVIKPLGDYYITNDTRNPANPIKRHWAHCKQCFLSDERKDGRADRKRVTQRAKARQKAARDTGVRPTGTKKCTKCHRVKDLTTFKWRTERQQHASSCKNCEPPRSPFYKLVNRHRKHMRGMLFDGKKMSVTQETGRLVGCSKEFLKAWLESNFTEGMTWEDKGSLHIDHVIACASFDLNSPEQREACFHWSNTFPLPSKDNLVKGSDIYDDYALMVQSRAECFVNRCNC